MIKLLSSYKTVIRLNLKVEQKKNIKKGKSNRNLSNNSSDLDSKDSSSSKECTLR